MDYQIVFLKNRTEYLDTDLLPTLAACMDAARENTRNATNFIIYDGDPAFPILGEVLSNGHIDWVRAH